MWRVFLLLVPLPALADSLVAARTLPAQTMIGPADVMLVDADIPGALSGAEGAVGLETRVAIYAGRPVRAQDIGAPALVERNAIVTLVYSGAGLSIRTEGRALARGGAGDTIRVMNLSSKTTVSGIVSPDGMIQVGALP